LQNKESELEHKILLSIIGGDILEWLRILGREYGELCRIVNFNSKTFKIRILENSEDAIELVDSLIPQQFTGHKMTPFIREWSNYSPERKMLVLMIARRCQEWLKELADKYGEIAKILDISPIDGKHKVLEIAKEAIELLKRKHPAFAPKEEGRSAR